MTSELCWYPGSGENAWLDILSNDPAKDFRRNVVPSSKDIALMLRSSAAKARPIDSSDPREMIKIMKNKQISERPRHVCLREKDLAQKLADKKVEERRVREMERRKEREKGEREMETRMKRGGSVGSISRGSVFNNTNNRFSNNGNSNNNGGNTSLNATTVSGNMYIDKTTQLNMMASTNVGLTISNGTNTITNFNSTAGTLNFNNTNGPIGNGNNGGPRSSLKESSLKEFNAMNEQNLKKNNAFLASKDVSDKTLMNNTFLNTQNTINTTTAQGQNNNGAVHLPMLLNSPNNTMQSRKSVGFSKGSPGQSPKNSTSGNTETQSPTKVSRSISPGSPPRNKTYPLVRTSAQDLCLYDTGNDQDLSWNKDVTHRWSRTRLTHDWAYRYDYKTFNHVKKRFEKEGLPEELVPSGYYPLNKTQEHPIEGYSPFFHEGYEEYLSEDMKKRIEEKKMEFWNLEKGVTDIKSKRLTNIGLTLGLDGKTKKQDPDKYTDRLEALQDDVDEVRRENKLSMKQDGMKDMLRPSSAEDYSRYVERLAAKQDSKDNNPSGQRIRRKSVAARANQQLQNDLKQLRTEELDRWKLSRLKKTRWYGVDQYHSSHWYNSKEDEEFCRTWLPEDEERKRRWSPRTYDGKQNYEDHYDPLTKRYELIVKQRRVNPEEIIHRDPKTNMITSIEVKNEPEDLENRYREYEEKEYRIIRDRCHDWRDLTSGRYYEKPPPIGEWEIGVPVLEGFNC